MGLLRCVIYMAFTGIAAFILGRLLPKCWFRGDAFPFRCRMWEQKLYKALHVKVWQDKVPDMSRLLPALMPPKKLTADTFSDLPRLSLTGLACLSIWPGIGGAILTAVYVLLGNVPFIIIQRYNRPRLQKLLAMQQRKLERKVNSCAP